jgi:hypothetical protein
LTNQPVRRSTLEALATRLNTETNPMVRRGLEESVYDLLDENTGYLDRLGARPPQDEDKDRIGEATKPWCATRPKCSPRCCARALRRAAKAF